jgi:protoheme ferro-lyase
MRYVTVLAMHGIPAKDFPKNELMELFAIHGRLTNASGPEREALLNRHDDLDRKMRLWPRTPKNDPFYISSQEIAKYLGEVLDSEVFVGFNEFCSPSVEGAIEKAAKKSSEKIIVVTPMMTSGGAHSEEDIPNAVKNARRKFPDIPIIYAWPFDPSEVAEFLAKQVNKFLS